MHLPGLDRWLTTDPREADQEHYERWLESEGIEEPTDDDYARFEQAMQDEYEQAMEDAAEARAELRADQERDDW